MIDYGGGIWSKKEIVAEEKVIDKKYRSRYPDRASKAGLHGKITGRKRLSSDHMGSARRSDAAGQRSYLVRES